ncbi:glucose 1-dehydrogenase [Arthrobacter sp. I2-34]|uniref:Glucose 1-dehydrogenase n=1 Tax=Arthrobacter hankyongi TaxID=2904801 RepID=A0ABS9L7H0_9MICC|nr:glucose 1-dehydrogenase [Arthrobacter hankyongi]MCG2622609.1 glucose 1-dehydrogenase [Arthrobacter hankyongi]
MNNEVQIGRVEGKVVFITGGASGIGRAAAYRLAEDGATIIVADVDPAGAAETVAGVESRGQKAMSLRLDVTDEENWRQGVASVVETFGRIDALFNSAGIYVIADLDKTSLTDWNRVMDINVTGTFLGMKHVVPVMAEHGGGTVLNMSSAAGMLGFAGHTAYGASKGAVRIMSKDVAMEWGRKQVRVNTIHPGYVATGMADYGAAEANTTLDELGAAYPLGRIAQPEDIANLVLFLTSDEASFITGAEIPIDGGATAGSVVGGE